MSTLKVSKDEYAIHVSFSTRDRFKNELFEKFINNMIRAWGDQFPNKRDKIQIKKVAIK